MRTFRTKTLLLALLSLAFASSATLSAKQPNILFIFSEDNAPFFGRAEYP